MNKIFNFILLYSTNTRLDEHKTWQWHHKKKNNQASNIVYVDFAGCHHKHTLSGVWCGKDTARVGLLISRVPQHNKYDFLNSF